MKDKNIKKILLISFFLVLFIIQYLSLFWWSFLIYGSLESVFLDYSPSGNTAIFLLNLFHIVLTSLISLIAVIVYNKTKNKGIFWIIYAVSTIMFFIITVLLFSGSYI